MSMSSLFLLFHPLFWLACCYAIYLHCLRDRRLMERRASDMLKQNPDAALESEILPLRSTFRGGKQNEIDARATHRQLQGWTLLKVTSINPLISIWYWGGAVQLHFIKISSKSSVFSPPAK